MSYKGSKMEIKLVEKTSNGHVISSTAGRLSRAEGTVSEVYNLSKNKTQEDNDKFTGRVVNMGHTSIIDHLYYNFTIENVTPVIEQILIASRYCSLTIKSRREANYGNKVYHIPNFKDNNGILIPNQELLIKKYKENVENLFDAYQFFVDSGIKVEDARYILPYCFHSQILFGADATECIRIINEFKNGVSSKIDEAKEFGNQLYNSIKNESEYTDLVIKNNKYEDSSPIKSLLDDFITSPITELENKAYALNEDEFDLIDKKIALNAIMRIYGMNLSDATNILNSAIEKDDLFMAKLFDSINRDYNKKDLESIYIRFQLPISYANLTHITRHRGVSLSIPNFTYNTNLENIIIPESIKNNDILLETFERVKNDNILLYNELKQLGVREEDLVYFNLSANVTNIVVAFDGDTFRHISSLRSCNKAQWEIRSLANFMLNVIEKHSEYYSKIIGASCAVNNFCPEKKECCMNPYPCKKLIKK